MPRKNSCPKKKKPAKKSGLNSRKPKKNPAKKSGLNSRKPKKNPKGEQLVPGQNLQNSGISTRKMTARSLKKNIAEQFSDPSNLVQPGERASTLPLMAAKNINKLPLRQLRDPEKLTSVKKESVSRKKAPEKIVTKTATNLSAVRKEPTRKNPIKKSERKDIVAPLKEKLQKKLKDKMEAKKLALAQKKKINKKQSMYEIKVLDNNAMKRIYSVEILPVKCIDVSHINPNLLPGIKTYGDFNNYSQRLASTVGKGEIGNELKSSLNASIHPASSARHSNQLNSDYPDTAVPWNQNSKKTRTAHCIHARDSQAIQGSVDEQVSNYNFPKISDEVQFNRLVDKNASNSSLRKSTLSPRQLKKKMQQSAMNEKLTTTLPEALASWLKDFYVKLRDPSEEEI